MSHQSTEVMRTLFEKLVELDEISSQDDEILRSLNAQSEKLSQMTNKILRRDPEFESYKLARQAMAKGLLRPEPHPSESKENIPDGLNSSQQAGSQASFGLPTSKAPTPILSQPQVKSAKPAGKKPQQSTQPPGPQKPKLTGKEVSQAANKHSELLKQQEGNMKERIEKMLKYCK